MSELTEERGSNYGHPADQFPVVEQMVEAWRNGRAINTCEGVDATAERCLRHTVYMICTKLSRACENPLHMDNWADIKGYAECFEMCVERLRFEDWKKNSDNPLAKHVTLKEDPTVITPFDDQMVKLKEIVKWMEGGGQMPSALDEEEGLAR